MFDADVIIAGGGPAGSATAALLARAGHDVLLLDRARFPRPKACAEYLSPATGDALARLGALGAVEAHRPVRPLGMHLIYHGAPRALVRYPDNAAPRRALCLPRDILDATLLDHARAAGVRVLEGTQVLRAGADARAAHVIMRDVAEPVTRTRQLFGRIVIGADGARSVVASSFTVRRASIWPRRMGLVAHYELPAHDDGTLERYGEMHVGRGAYCGLAPLPDRRVNVGLVTDAATTRRVARASGTEGAFEAGLIAVPGARQRLRGASRVSPIRGVSPLAVRVARPFGERFLLVGDAAGFLDPFTGEGVFRALRGAEIASEEASSALRDGDLSAGRLARYSKRRVQEFWAKDALCWVIQVLLVAPPLLSYVLRRLATRERQGDVLGAVLGDYHPASAALHPTFLWGLLRP